MHVSTSSPLDPDPDARVAAYRELRQQGSVVPFPGADGVFAAVSYDTVDAGLRTVENFSGSAGQDGVPEVDRNIAALEEPRHGMVRRIMNSVVAFHKSQQIEAYLQDLTHRLMDAFLDDARASTDSSVDAVEHLAGPIPPAAMARLCGFPEEESALYYAWIANAGKKYQEAAASGRSVSMADANPEQAGYVDGKIEARLALPREEWPEDALTRFLVTEVEGETLEPRNIRAQIMFMLGAGSETTRSLIGNLLYRLARDPDAYAALRADPELIDVAIEESLRLDAPAQFMVRTCKKPTELGGETVEAGQKVFMCIGSGNHDDARFDDPDHFRLDRDTRDHLSFGSGPHVCPGAALARLEVRTLMREYTRRVASFRLADPDQGFDAVPTGMLQSQRTLRLVVEEQD
jgi:cytochrome P450